MEPSSSSSSSVITPEDVLKTLMNDGTIDAIRLKIITQLKANVSATDMIVETVECLVKKRKRWKAARMGFHFPVGYLFKEELKSTTIKMVEQSKVLNTPGAEKQTKRELFDALRQELETSVLEKASKSVWELVLDNQGLGKEISDTVESVFCRLSGREPPLFSSNDVTQSEKANGEEKESEGGKGKEKEKENENEENSDSASKKRKYDEMNMEEGADEVTNRSGNPPAVLDDSSKMPGQVLCKSLSQA